MIIYLVAATVDDFKFKDRYQHILFTFGSAKPDKLEEKAKGVRNARQKKRRIKKRSK